MPKRTSVTFICRNGKIFFYILNIGLDVLSSPPSPLVSAALRTVCGVDRAFAVGLMPSCCMQRERVLKFTVMHSECILTADCFTPSLTHQKLITRQEQEGSPLQLCMDEGGFKFEIQVFGGDVGVLFTSKVKRTRVENDCFISRNLNYWAVVHNLVEFVGSQLFMRGVVIVNGRNVP